MPSLRGHHLICLHFFHGEGYNPEFTENLRNTINTAEDSDIDICSGADDICRKCPYLRNNFCKYNENADEETNEMDRKALELLGLSIGIKASWNRINEMLPQILPKWYSSYCKDCDWIKVCEENEFFRRLK